MFVFVIRDYGVYVRKIPEQWKWNPSNSGRYRAVAQLLCHTIVGLRGSSERNEAPTRFGSTTPSDDVTAIVLQ